MARKSRPNYLVLVTHPNQDLNLWSAHHSEGDARLTHDRLKILLGASKSAVHLIEVPATEGVMDASTSAAPASGQPAAMPQPAEPPKPFKRKSPEAFLAETQELMEGGLQMRDADASLGDDGAFS
jgi:hypothetical protein